jgi:WD40 repeat protein/3',5'-cyclic AMP phosphodiesterase CpdA
MPGDNVTILHLSDLQFGKFHRFGPLALTPDDQYDTLMGRLRDDLDALKESHGLRPNVIIATGDLAEWAKPQEFTDAARLLADVSSHLQIPRHSVVIIPGNHDVNRKACESYFNGCEADDQKPVAPFSPKWKQYLAMFEQFYKDQPNIRFTVEEPWTLFEIPELCLVVAGLNSTMAECHELKLDEKHPWYADFVKSGRFGQFGQCGERQYRWFAERLKSFKAKGWLRVGAIHHNYLPVTTGGADNLRDADELQRFLGESLNLLLHGHTHEAKPQTQWISPALPVLSTGSAGVSKEWRAEEVLNQYQILRLHSDRIERFTRCFHPQQKKWIGDTSVSPKGDRWQTEEKTRFESVHATFCTSGPGVSPKEHKSEHDQREHLRGEDIRSDTFLNRVAEVCRHRRPNAEVTLILDQPPFQYLRVVEKQDGFVRQYPVGVFSEMLDATALQTFLAQVDAKYRASDPALTSEIVFGACSPLPEGLRREAERRRVRVQSFTQYQGILDFCAYVEKQTQRLEADKIYPPSLYVPQRMGFAIGTETGRTEDALGQVTEWLASPDARFMLILGDFGTGKTFLLHELARRIGTSDQGLTPLLIELRALEKARTLDTLVAQHLAAAGMDRIDLAAFRYMLRQGRVVLLFDGFDELALRVTYTRAAEHFDTILQATGEDSKVIVTSRTQHFESESQVRTVLYERAQPVAGLRYCKLQPFAETQIRHFLRNRWGSEKEAEHWFDLLRHVRDLLGLSENPRMLGFITELKKEDIARAKQKQGVISAAELYRLLLEKWLVFEYDRAHPPGSQITLKPEARWAAVTAVAHRLWMKTEKFLTLAELVEETTAAIQKTASQAPPDIAAHLIGSGSLLRRDDEGCFFFVHQSVMEWLVAREAADTIGSGYATATIDIRPMSPLMIDFFCDLAGRETALRWAQNEVNTPNAGTQTAKDNALEVLKRLGGNARLSFSSQDLRGRDLGNSLAGADFSGANLTEARLTQANLADACLDGAKLLRADLTGATLTGASAKGTDFSEARMLGADLRGVDLRKASLRRAKLIGARVELELLEEAQTFGAALPGSSEIHPMVLPGPSPCNGVAWSPDGTLLVAGHDDGSVRLLECSTGKELRQFKGHTAYVTSVAFSPDGQWLASASADQSVRLWQCATGKELRLFKGHTNVVFSVVFSPNGQWLASASADQSVRLWQCATGKELRLFKRHTASVRSVAFSPDSQWLASASEDQRVRLWDCSTGKELRLFKGHTDAVLSVAFSPDGQWLASGGADQRVRLWECATGKELRLFKGHTDAVLSVAFSRDGQWLASSSYAPRVRLWECATGKELRVFKGYKAPVLSVAFSPDGRWLASASADQGVRLWECSTGKELRLFKGYKAPVWSVAFSPDGQWLASASADKSVRLWECSTGKELRQFKGHTAYVLSVAFSPNGQRLASASTDKSVRLWERATGKELSMFEGHSNYVWSVAFSPDGQWLASASADKSARLWECSTGKELRQFKGHTASVLSVAFSPDGQWLASASDDKSVRLWQCSTSKQLRQFKGHTASVLNVAFSPNGQWLASASADKSVRLWQCSTGNELRQFKGHTASVLSVVFSPDGQWLASASNDQSVRLWECSTGKELRQFKGHTAYVLSVAFSPDGQWLVSGSADNTIRLWRVRTGACVAVLVGLPEGWVVFSPNGRYNFSGNVIGNFWHLIALCRFEAGELDPFLPDLRLKPNELLLTPP